MPKQVPRLSPRAACLLEKLAASEGKKPAEFLSELVIAYNEGLRFHGTEEQP